MLYSYKSLKLARDRDEVILRVCSGKRVLHIGAADSPHTQEKLSNGLLLHKRLQEVASQLVGIDLDGPAVEWMNSQGLPKTLVMNMDQAARLEFTPEVIVFGETIEHLLNVGLCLETLKSCMSPTTRLVISTPNCYHLWFMSMVFRNYETLHEDHKVGFSYGLLRQALKTCGLRLESFYFTFLPRARYPWWRRAWYLASRFRHGFAETLLAICVLDETSSGRNSDRGPSDNTLRAT